MDHVFKSLTPFIVLIFFVFAVVYALLSKHSGNEIIHKFIQKRTLLIEMVLLLLNIVEAMVAASFGEKEGLSFGTRLSMHLGLSLLSSVIGFSIFKQVAEMQQAFKAQIGVVKETADVVLGITIMILAPLINTYYIAISLGTTNEVFAFFAGHLSAMRNPTTFIAVSACILHLAGVMHLGIMSYKTQPEVVEIVPEEEVEHSLPGK